MAKVSLQSSTTSAPVSIISAFIRPSRAGYGSTSTVGFSSASLAAALSALLLPTSEVKWSGWRGRFDSSTSSESTTPTRPTPAPTR